MNSKFLGHTGGYTYIDSPVMNAGDFFRASSLPNELIINLKKGDENKNMKTLYNVILVWFDGNIEIDLKVVAKNEEEAKLKAGVYTLLTNEAIELSDVTVIVSNLGNVKIKNKE